MSEQVTRYRGGDRDENGKLTAEEPPRILNAIAVAPGGGSHSSEKSRESESTAFTVYLPLGTDLTDDDELKVRGDRFRIIVNNWNMDRRGGLEVLCVRGQG